MGRYLSLLVWPARLSADYSYAQIPLARGTAGDWIAWVAVAAVAIGVAAVFRRHRASFFFGAFALLTFLPTSNLLFPTGTIMAERVMYLPSVGLIALFVIAVCQAAVCQAALDVERERFASFAFLVIVVALGTRTWMRNRDWNDDVTLWTAAAKASPSSFKAHRALAEALYASDPTHANIDVLDRAIGEMERSVTLLQPLPDALNDIRTHRQLAAYHLERGDLRGRPALANRTALPPESIGAYQKAASLLRRCLVIIEAASGDRPHGAAAADANRLLSAVYVRLHEADKAVDAALRARALEPSQVVGHQQLAAALLTAERYEEAAVALMAGSLLTSRPELRQQLIDLYRQGLDPLRCAVASIPTGSTGPTSLVLDPSCATVRRHLCAATVDAIALQTGAGERDDAERLRTSANELGCATGR